jgi:phosphonate transport system substrate-binding protein
MKRAIKPATDRPTLERRKLLKALNLDGFIAGTPDIFDSIRKLAQSVPGSGVTA